MSHHLDTPLARQNGQLYIDDLCVFPANGGTVFVMDVNSTITEPHVQPGFHPEAHYEFKLHFDRAEFEELTYRVSFGERESDGSQALQLHALTGEAARDDFAVGELLLEGRTGEVATNGDVDRNRGARRDTPGARPRTDDSHPLPVPLRPPFGTQSITSGHACLPHVWSAAPGSAGGFVLSGVLRVARHNARPAWRRALLRRLPGSSRGSPGGRGSSPERPAIQVRC